MKSYRALCCCLFILSLSPSIRAQVQDTPNAVESVDEQARARAAELANEASDLFGRELYGAALEAFVKAYELDPQATYAYNIAVCYERLGDSTNCVEFYEAYISRFRAENDGAAPDDLVDVRNSIAKCQFGAKVEVSIDSTPSGANVSIGQRTSIIGQTPMTTRQDPGRYEVFIELPGFQPIRKELEIRSGQPVKLVFNLDKIQRTGFLQFNVNIKGATIFVDGRPIGLTPYNDAIEVDEGVHQITVQKDDYVTFSEELVVEATREYGVEANLWLKEKPTSWKGYLGWTTIGIGAALAVGGVVAGQQAGGYFAGGTEDVVGANGLVVNTLTFPASDDYKMWSQLEQIGLWTGGGLLAVGLTLVILEATDIYAIDEDDALDDVGLDQSRPMRIRPILGWRQGGGLGGAHIEF